MTIFPVSNTLTNLYSLPATNNINVIHSTSLESLARLQSTTLLNPLIQDTVSLSSTLSTITENSAGTYNAQGLYDNLLQNFALNDPLLQLGSTDTAMSSAYNSTLFDPTFSTSDLSTIPGVNTGLATFLQQNPTLATELTKEITSQNLINVLA